MCEKLKARQQWIRTSVSQRRKKYGIFTEYKIQHKMQINYVAHVEILLCNSYYFTEQSFSLSLIDEKDIFEAALSCDKNWVVIPCKSFKLDL